MVFDEWSEEEDITLIAEGINEGAVRVRKRKRKIYNNCCLHGVSSTVVVREGTEGREERRGGKEVKEGRRERTLVERSSRSCRDDRAGRGV